jgi:hypothetical protein
VNFSRPIFAVAFEFPPSPCLHDLRCHFSCFARIRLARRNGRFGCSLLAWTRCALQPVPTMLKEARRSPSKTVFLLPQPDTDYLVFTGYQTHPRLKKGKRKFSCSVLMYLRQHLFRCTSCTRPDGRISRLSFQRAGSDVRAGFDHLPRRRPAYASMQLDKCPESERPALSPLGPSG